MPKIDIRRPHHLSITAAREVVDNIAATLQEKFGMENHWHDNILQFSGTGITGTISISNDAVHVSARLGLLFSPFKDRIEQDIRAKLEQHFV